MTSHRVTSDLLRPQDDLYGLLSISFDVNHLVYTRLELPLSFSIEWIQMLLRRHDAF